MPKKLLITGLAAIFIAAVVVLLFSRDRKLTSLFRESKLKTTMRTDEQKNPPANESTQTESPFACNLGALDTMERVRHLAVMLQLHQATEEVRELPDGYALRLADSMPNITLASEFIARERLCCPFFSFELVVEKERGPLWLQLRGREGVKAFIEAEFNLKG